MRVSKSQKLQNLLRRRRVIRSRDVDTAGIPRNYLVRMVRKGRLSRIDRGFYGAELSSPSEHSSLVEVSRRIPKGVICLLSALRFHELGTQLPSEVWVAIEGKAWKPKIQYPPVRIMRFSGKSMRFGVEKHEREGETIKVYSSAKTVADCFKFRHKIGTDVALEALRDCYRRKKATMNELWTAAKVCRVANVMRPYMESLA